jgi:cation diffusion facilitator family transporter
MNTHNHSRWEHSHEYTYGHERENERRTMIVMLLTAVMMVIEITCGWLFNSMALLADGWHMSTHAAALGIGYFAYRYARIHAKNPDYSFGTGKVHALGSYSSAFLLAFVAFFVFGDSLWTLINPQPIQYNEALMVAVIGLVVNVVSIKLLHVGNHEHDDEHSHSHSHGHEHDHNLKAAYAHVIVDAMTSIFAIVALLAGKYFHWLWVDPLVGIVGAVIIAQWSYNLIRTSVGALLDRQPSEDITNQIKNSIQSDGDSQIVDLHVWEVAPGRLSAIVSVVSHEPRTVEEYRERLSSLGLAHLTVEFNQCNEKSLLNNH